MSPEINFNFKLWCTCGNGLCRNTTPQQYFTAYHMGFRVKPCEKCLEKARASGYQEGYTAAQKAKAEPAGAGAAPSSGPPAAREFEERVKGGHVDGSDEEAHAHIRVTGIASS